MWLPDCRANNTCHAPRKRGIQYAAAYRFKPHSLWNAGSPRSRLRQDFDGARAIRPAEALAEAASRATTAEFVLRTQRVGILDHIRPAAGGRARGEQYEAVGGKHPAREIAADREVIRDVLARRIVEPRQRDMRGEFAPLRIEADPLHQPFELRLQLDQRLAR